MKKVKERAAYQKVETEQSSRRTRPAVRGVFKVSALFTTDIKKVEDRPSYAEDKKKDARRTGWYVERLFSRSDKVDGAILHFLD